MLLSLIYNKSNSCSKNKLSHFRFFDGKVIDSISDNLYTLDEIEVESIKIHHLFESNFLFEIELIIICFDGNRGKLTFAFGSETSKALSKHFSIRKHETLSINHHKVQSI